MAEQTIESYRIISVNQLVKTVAEGQNNAERFCFIIGAGASVSSGIPAGIDLECEWMREMERAPGLEEISEIARKLREDNRLENDFEEIKKAWEETRKSGTPFPSEFYFDIYKLRFFPNHRNGYHYLEKVMDNKNPSFGYHPLALMLTDGSGNNLVITTNFDSLVEDALFLYTDSKPLVINHELLADYAGDPNIKRPIIAKVHRGIFFDPLNQPEETNELKGKWHDVLVSVFQNYTPIVIGYGGGDNSLMNLLAEDNVRMKNGIYWCYVEKYGLPNQKIQTLVREKKGYLVRTAGFDATMLALGNALFPDKIGVHETEAYLNNRTSMQIANYEEEYKKLTECEVVNHAENAVNQTTQSEDEFRKEIEKMAERGNVSEKERQTQDQMTAWDYRRQGDRYYKSEEYDSAIQSYTTAINMQNNVAQFYNDRGCAYNSLGKYDEAISDYDKAISLNPEFFAAYNNRGVTCRNLGNYDEAISNLDKAIELNPEHAMAYTNRGFTYNKLGEYDKAIADYDKAIELKPDFTEAYNSRGIVYKNVSDYDKAIADYDKAINLDSEYSYAYNNRGAAYIALGNYEKAVSDLDRAIALNPTLANSYKHYGMIWEKKENYEKAIQYLTKALELNPQYKEAYLERAEVYRLMGNAEKAITDEAIAAKL